MLTRSDVKKIDLILRLLQSKKYFPPGQLAISGLLASTLIHSTVSYLLLGKKLFFRKSDFLPGMFLTGLMISVWYSRNKRSYEKIPFTVGFITGLSIVIPAVKLNESEFKKLEKAREALTSDIARPYESLLFAVALFGLREKLMQIINVIIGKVGKKLHKILKSKLLPETDKVMLNDKSTLNKLTKTIAYYLLGFFLGIGLFFIINRIYKIKKGKDLIDFKDKYLKRRLKWFIGSFLVALGLSAYLKGQFGITSIKRGKPLSIKTNKKMLKLINMILFGKRMEVDGDKKEEIESIFDDAIKFDEVHGKPIFYSKTFNKCSDKNKLIILTKFRDAIQLALDKIKEKKPQHYEKIKKMKIQFQLIFFVRFNAFSLDISDRSVIGVLADCNINTKDPHLYHKLNTVQLASIIAHELNHTLSQHTTAMLFSNIVFNILNIFGYLYLISRNTSLFIDFYTQLVLHYIYYVFTRNMETESDAFAVELFGDDAVKALKILYSDPEIRRVSKRYGFEESHNDPDLRIEEMLKRLEKIKSKLKNIKTD